MSVSPSRSSLFVTSLVLQILNVVYNLCGSLTASRVSPIFLDITRLVSTWRLSNSDTTVHVAWTIPTDTYSWFLCSKTRRDGNIQTWAVLAHGSRSNVSAFEEVASSYAFRYTCQLKLTNTLFLGMLEPCVELFGTLADPSTETKWMI